MIINLYIIILDQVRLLEGTRLHESPSCIHTYLALGAVVNISTTDFYPSTCPNCNYALPSIFARWQRHIAFDS
jgi:hypothetical protein